MRGDFLQRLLANSSLSIFVSLLLVLSTFVVNRLIVDAHSNQLTSETATYAKSFAARLESRVQVRLGVVKLIQKNWESGQIRNFGQFREEAQSVHNLFRDLQALNWVSAEGVIEVVTPLRDNEAAVGLDIRTLQGPALALAEAERTGETKFTPPISLAQGGTGFVAYLPIRPYQKTIGFLNIVFRTDPMIRSAMEKDLNASFDFWINDDGTPMYGGDLPDELPAHLVRTAVEIGDRTWDIVTAPTPEKVAQASTIIDELVLFAGLALSLATGFLIFLAANRQRYLKASEERFAYAMRGANDGLWDWNLKTGEIYFSPRWFEMLGYSPDELPNKHDTFLSLLHPEDKQHVKAYPSQVIQQNADATESEFRMCHKNGTWVNILSRAFLIRQNNKVERIVGTHVDITDRKNSEEALTRAQEILRDGLETLPVGFAYYDADQRLLEFNQNYPKLLSSRTLHLQTGMTNQEIMFESPAFATARKLATNGELQSESDFDWVYQRSDLHWIKAIERPASGGGFIHVIEDITDFRRNQERLQQTHKMEAIGQLTGGIAHDFNNLLAVIMGNAELLDETISGATEFTSAIVHATNRGAELTQRLLAFARQQPLHPEAVDLSVLISRSQKMLDRTLGETIDIRITVPDDLRKALADPGQIENAVLNLALNARDAMPGGGVLAIECANVRIEHSETISGEPIANGDYVALSVRDQGTGMTPEVRANAFNPFFTTKGVGEGSGLGLSMVYGFAQQSGGQATIKTAEGQGTTVTLYLPRAESPDTAQTAASPSPSTNGHGETILVLEDDAEVRKLVGTMLESLGYAAIYAEDAATARNVVDTVPDIRLLLSDVVLPGGVSGPEFAAGLKDNHADLKTIFMSGYPADAIGEGSPIHLDGVLLNKPFGKETLAQALRHAL